MYAIAPNHWRYRLNGLMKHSATAFTIIFLNLFCPCRAQNFEFIPDTNAYWTINTFVISATVPLPHYGVKGDTVISGHTYYQIHQSNDSSWNEANTTYFCAVRQNQDQWLFMPKSDTAEYLLYDFNVVIGDTVTIHNPWTTSWVPNVKVKVASIDSVLINGVYKTRVGVQDFFVNQTSEYWIEGVGSTNGLIYSGFKGLEWHYQLICFHKDDTLQYINSPNDDCYYANGLSVAELEGTEPAYLFPNPGRGLFNLQLNDLKGADIEIYNMNGERLYLEREVNAPIYEFEFDHPPGVYLMYLHAESATTYLKMVVE